MNAWYEIADIDRVDSPALVVYPDRVRHNIALLISMIDDVKRLRPHVKTHKSPQATQMQLDAGIRKFKCATIAEAEMLGECGAADVLLAYQPVGPKLDRFITVSRRYPGTEYSCLVDDREAAKAIAAKAKEAGIKIPVWIDLNVGMNRTGIAADEHAAGFYQYCCELKDIFPVGLHVYDGHIHDKDFLLRKKKSDEAFALVEEVAKRIIADGMAAPKIIAGGSPTFSIHAKRRNVECSPGTFIFWDAGYKDLLEEQPFLTAALVISRVISHPAPDLFCTDLGHKSVAAERNLDQRIRFLNAPSVKMISQSEEHLVIQPDEMQGWNVGKVLYGLPYHICPTCALYDRAITVIDGKVSGTWEIGARRRVITV
jgi:D-serine deaminase-like pyridoxal phosphate-dependent protein